MTERNRLILVSVALFMAGTTAMIWGASARIDWLFWGVGLPVEVITIVYTFIAVGFIQLWNEERR